MRCTERLIGGSCIRLAFIHESTPLKKRKIRYTHIYLLFWLSGWFTCTQMRHLKMKLRPCCTNWRVQSAALEKRRVAWEKGILPKWRNAFRWSRESIFSFPYQLKLREWSIFTDQGHPAYSNFCSAPFSHSFLSQFILFLALRWWGCAALLLVVTFIYFNRVITSNPFQFATVVAGVLKLKKMGTDAR
jgi:hypothetical protein